MPTVISRNQLIAGICTQGGIQSATWDRKTDKWVNRCSICNAECARHGKEWFCNACDSNVSTWREKMASKGDEVTLQFRRPLNHEGTKNWTPAGGFMFGAATRGEAEAIKRRRGLIQVCKMSETGTNDLRAMPRCIPVFLIRKWKSGGVDYEVRDG